MPRSENRGRPRPDGNVDGDDTATHPVWKGKTHKAKDGTLNGMKKRTRTIERQFKRGIDMPATVRNELERELRSLKASIGAIENRRNRGHMIKKYHMVRFFERQKASRKLKKAQKALIDSPDDKKIKQDAYVYEIDHDYTHYYPFLERYISLYANKGEEESNTVPPGHVPVPGLKGVQRPPIWSVVAEAKKLGLPALERLRDRLSSDVDPLQEPGHEATEDKEEKKQAKLKGKKGKEKKDDKSKGERKGEKTAAAAAADSSDSGDDSDGGFFE
ncbi:rRNA-processing protein EFG1 [Ceratocystis platani]|uniref:rRNA-processing protein EFG1 n=1 Tax=Ceratocystis fimbriata f. sp. platani TaxID=88771 RepID=A0A0F8CNN8_CERFI|nr:rRNA-processing protein EFG1 [Ceratocystis platani]